MKEKGQVNVLHVEGTGGAGKVQVIGGSRTVGTWVWGRWVQHARALAFWGLLRGHVVVELG